MKINWEHCLSSLVFLLCKHREREKRSCWEQQVLSAVKWKTQRSSHQLSSVLQLHPSSLQTSEEQETECLWAASSQELPQRASLYLITVTKTSHQICLSWNDPVCKWTQRHRAQGVIPAALRELIWTKNLLLFHSGEMKFKSWTMILC